MTASIDVVPAAPRSLAARETVADGWAVRCCERGWLPDWLVRAGMRRLTRQRLRDEGLDDPALAARRGAAVRDELRHSPVAVETAAANEQHYEVPAAFFAAHLGPHLKYSCCLFERGTETLGEAEQAMLERYAERAGLADGQRILDLGCGWGSLSLWLAARFPCATIVGLSNSHGQRSFIEGRAASLGLTNLTIVTGDVVDFEFDDSFAARREPAGAAGALPAAHGADLRFDRVLSIEMFEHMKNYRLLLAKVARWMRDDAKLFVHVFAHRTLAYHFEVHDGSDWMSKYFFTGGTMPSYDLLPSFDDDLRVTQRWWVDGLHYMRTANEWLWHLDRAREQVMPTLVQTYGARDAARWLQRWRMFYMAVAELFGYDNGAEWGVAHYLFDKRVADTARDERHPTIESGA